MHGLPSHIVRLVAMFLLDRIQRVKIRDTFSNSGHPNGEYRKEHCLDLNVS
ncbi:hypothetical protein NP493_406g02021 [Ridgeia piscesae]|uniref:Uncharacterized protein n=1 Tax=Ridgeia piscesae TaxID=27915 RepID=A0AAD9L0W1_RIDPI|nr:hypothetical protein NP493_406g02021 [Ridgeia piscesae]